LKNFLPLAASAAVLMFASASVADPIRINDTDEGYSRLARWEQHLDDTIAADVRDNSISPRRAWAIQKNLDSVEAHVIQSYYESDNGIDRQTFRKYAGQLNNIGNQLGENDWGSRNIYGDGWGEDRGDYSSGEDRDRDHNSSNYPPAAGNYYREGDYERSCHEGNAATGTIFGAIAGGLIGGAVSHGNGGAVVGGVILGGVLGNTLARDIDCDDQRYAFDAYGNSLNGEIGREYDWEHGTSHGTFMSTREYRDGDQLCRDFRTTTYRNGQRYDREGTACRTNDGNWQTR
jgi:surface antigen